MKVYDLKQAFGLTFEDLDIDYPELSLDDLHMYVTRNNQPMVWLTKDDSKEAKASYRARHASCLSRNAESVTYLDASQDANLELPEFIDAYIEDKGIRVLNTAALGWQDRLNGNVQRNGALMSLD